MVWGGYSQSTTLHNMAIGDEHNDEKTYGRTREPGDQMPKVANDSEPGKQYREKNEENATKQSHKRKTLRE